MLNDFFDFVDDTVIDRFFQPMCDRIRTNFGWSKRAPMAAMKVIAIIGLLPLCVVIVNVGGIFYIPAAFMFLWIVTQVMLIVALIGDELHNDASRVTGSSSALDEYRIKGKRDRKIALVLSVLTLPLVLTGMLITESNYVASFYLIGGVANLCDGFFRACTDLPKGKSVLTRVRELLRSFTNQPVPQSP